MGPETPKLSSQEREQQEFHEKAQEAVDEQYETLRAIAEKSDKEEIKRSAEIAARGSEAVVKGKG